MAQTVAATRDLNNFSLLEEPIQDGRGRRHVAQELAPFFNGPIGGHEGGAILVSADNDLQENLGAFGREVLHPKIVDGQQIGFEKTVERALGFGR